MSTFYLLPDTAVAGASGIGTMQDGGTAPTAATAATGWTVGKSSAGLTAFMDDGTTGTTAAFSSDTTTPKPAATIDNSSTSASVRSQFAYQGSFAAAAWTFQFGCIATTASSQVIAFKIRVFASADPTGQTGLREISPTGGTRIPASGGWTGSTTAGTTSGTWTPSATITLAKEYLFVSVACLISTAGGSNTANCKLRNGTTLITTSTFTPDTISDSVTTTGVSASDSPSTSASASSFEGSVSNWVSNSEASGATAPSIPPHWRLDNAGGATVTYAYGTENGLPYVDMAVSGGSSGFSFRLYADDFSHAPQATSDTWTYGLWARVISGSLPSLALIAQGYGSGGAPAGSGGNDIFPPTGSDVVGSSTTLNTHVLTPSLSTGWVRFTLALDFTVAGAMNFTLRLARPFLTPFVVSGAVAPARVAATTGTANPGTTIDAPSLPPALSTLSDNFDGTTLDTSKWSPYSDATHTIGLSGDGVLQMANTNGSSGSAGVTSARSYNLIGSQMVAKMTVPPGLSGAGVGYQINFQLDGPTGTGSNNLYFQWASDGTSTGQLSGGYVTNNSGFSIGSALIYSPTQHAWLRIRESGGTVYLDYAPASASNPPVSGDWTNYGSVAASSLGWDDTYVTPRLQYGAWQAVTQVETGPMTWDAFNATATVFGTPVSVTEVEYNWIRNNTLVGGVAGSGGTGTEPTNWSTSAGGTLLALAFGSIGNIPYIDHWWNGTTPASGETDIRPETGTFWLPAVEGEVWTFSSYCQVVTDDAQVGDIDLEVIALSASTELSRNGASFSSDRTTWARRQVSHTMPAGTAFVLGRLRFSYTGTPNLNFKVRMGLPQMQRGPMTAVVLTSGTALPLTGDGELGSYASARSELGSAADGVSLGPVTMSAAKNEGHLNWVRNNTFSGASVAAWNAGGTPPGMTPFALGVLNCDTVGLGQATATDGTLVDYIDLRFYTPSGQTTDLPYMVYALDFRGDLPVSGGKRADATPGLPMTMSAYVALIAGSTSGISQISLNPWFAEGSDSVAYTEEYSGAMALTSSLARYSVTATPVNSNTRATIPRLSFSQSTGVSIDITLRIGSPVYEDGTSASPINRTSGTWLGLAYSAPSSSTTSADAETGSAADAPNKSLTQALAETEPGSAVDTTIPQMAPNAWESEISTPQNYIPNSNATGGTSSVLPTGWTITLATGISASYAYGTENGLPYVDVALSGSTSTSGLNTTLKFNAPGPDGGGGWWTFGLWMKLTSGSWPGTNNIVTQISGSGQVFTTPPPANAVLGSDPTQGLHWSTISTGTTVDGALQFQHQASTTYSCTFRVALPFLLATSLSVTQRIGPDRIVKTSGTATPTAVLDAPHLNLTTDIVAISELPTPINYITNAAMAGGTSSALPTDWSATGLPSGVTASYAYGTENSIPYIDISMTGTAASGSTYQLTFGSPTTARNGEWWTGGLWAKLMSGTLPGSAFETMTFYGFNGNGGALIFGDASSTLGDSAGASALQRQAGAGTTGVGISISFSFLASTSYAFTLRLGLPWLVPGLTHALRWDQVAYTTGTRVVESLDSTSQTPVLAPSETEPGSAADAPAAAATDAASEAEAGSAADAPNRTMSASDKTYELLSSPANYVSNSEMVGGVAPSTLPTDWSLTSVPAGIAVSYAYGTENGIPYIDLIVSGTAPSNKNMVLSFGSFANAARLSDFAQGEQWTQGVWAKLVAGTFPAQSSSLLSIQPYDSSGSALLTSAAQLQMGGSGDLLGTDPTTGNGSFSANSVSATGTVAVTLQLALFLPGSQATSYTLRLGRPWLLRGNYNFSGKMPGADQVARTTGTPVPMALAATSVDVLLASVAGAEVASSVDAEDAQQIVPQVDSGSASDAPAAAATDSANEAEAGSASESPDRSINLAEVDVEITSPASGADSPAASPLMADTASEAASATESEDRTESASRSQTEAGSGADSPASSTGVHADTETGTAAESPSGSMAATGAGSENATGVDASTVSPFSEAASEVGAATDTPTQIPVDTAAGIESGAGSDTSSVNQSAKVEAEAASAGETPAGSMAAASADTEAASGSESSSSNPALAGLGSETGGASDNSTETPSLAAVDAETGSGSDAPSVSGFTGSDAESASAAESPVGSMVASGADTESGSGTESSSVSPFSETTAESASAADAPSEFTAETAAENETGAGSDSSSVSPFAEARTEGASAAESPSGSMAPVAAETEAGTGADASTVSPFSEIANEAASAAATPDRTMASSGSDAESGTASDAASLSALSASGDAPGAASETGSSAFSAALTQADAGAGSDSSSRSMATGLAETETGAASDVPFALASDTAAGADAGAASDSGSGASVASATGSEAGTAVESEAESLVAPGAGAEAGAAAESGAAATASFGNESGAASESSTETTLDSALIAESSPVADTEMVASSSSASEAAASTDTDSASGASAATEAESVTAADAGSTTAADTAAGAEPGSAGEATSGIKTSGTTVLETGTTATESESGSGTAAAAGSDAAAASDTGSGSGAADGSQIDSASGSESSDRTAADTASGSESGSAAETGSGTPSQNQTLAESGVALESEAESLQSTSSDSETGIAVDFASVNGMIVVGGDSGAASDASSETNAETGTATESAAGTDQGTAVAGGNVTEQDTLADAQALSMAPASSGSETGSGTDTQTSTPTMVDAAAEPGTASDATVGTAADTGSTTEPGSAGDQPNVSGSGSSTITEPTSGGDSGTASAVMPAADTEAGSGADVSAQSPSITVADTEPGAPTDTPALAGTAMGVSETDSAAASESLAATGSAASSGTESGVAADTPFGALTKFAATTEALAVLDVESGVLLTSVGRVESGSASDVAAVGSFLEAIAESALAIAAELVSASQSSNQSEAVALVDQQAGSAQSSAQASEGATATDLQAVVAQVLAQITEAGILTESASGSHQSVALDVLSLQDLAVAAMQAAGIEAAAATEEQVLAALAVVAIQEDLTADEASTGVRLKFIATQEDANAQETMFVMWEVGASEAGDATDSSNRKSKGVFFRGRMFLAFN